MGVVAEAGESGVIVQPMIDFARFNEAIVLDFGVGGILPDPAEATRINPAIDRGGNPAGVAPAAVRP